MHWGARGVDSLKATVQIDGQMRDVALIVRETTEGEFYYDLRRSNALGARWARTQSSSVDSAGPAFEGSTESDFNIQISEEDFYPAELTPATVW